METINIIPKKYYGSLCRNFEARKPEGDFGEMAGTFPNHPPTKAHVINIIVESIFDGEIKALRFEGDLEIVFPQDSRYPAVILDRASKHYWEVYPRTPRPKRITDNVYYPGGIHPSNFHYYPNPRYEESIDGIPQIQVSQLSLER